MAPLIVEGIYKDGRVELAERPEGVAEGVKVTVTFAESRHDADTTERERLRQDAFAQMSRGLDLGGPPYLTREEIYAERIDELDRRRSRG
jgi:hypothetical protein